MEEVWKDIKGYKDLYKISNLGRIKSLERLVEYDNKKYIKPERILKPIKVSNYLGVQLSYKSKVQKFYIHRLVCEHFQCNEENKPCVNHIDGNKYNNSIDNLEWVTHSENNIHSFKNGLRNDYGERNFNTLYTDEQVLNIRRLYNTGKYTQRELCKVYNMSPMTIHRIVKYKLRKRLSK